MKWRTHLIAVRLTWGLGGTSPKASVISRRRSVTGQLIYDATTEFMRQVDRAIAKSRQTVENSTEDDEQNSEFAEALLLIIVALMIVQGAIYFGRQTVVDPDNGVSTTELTGYSSGIDTGAEVIC